MKILLDTQALILAGNDSLPKLAKRTYLSSANLIYFSDVSLWEIGIKASLGKLKFSRKIVEYQEHLVNQGLLALPISATHIECAVGLPWHHKDPFDRLLIGQSLSDSMTVLTGDLHFKSYGCKIIWD